MQALSSHYEIYKRVCFYTRLWSTRLWSQSSFLLSAPGVVTMTFSGVVSRNTSPTASLPSAVTSLNATGTTLGAPLAQVASVCPVCQEALSGENGLRFSEITILFLCADIHLAPPKRKKAPVRWFCETNKPASFRPS